MQGEEKRNTQEDASAICKQNILFSLESTRGVRREANACRKWIFIDRKVLVNGNLFLTQAESKVLLGGNKP